MVCIKETQQPRRALKLLKLGKELSSAKFKLLAPMGLKICVATVKENHLSVRLTKGVIAREHKY